MKKIILTILFLLVTFCANSQNDEYQLDNISQKYWGIWIPKSFDSAFRKSGIYSTSFSKYNQNKEPHDILIVEQNKIWSDNGFHDGYAIKRDDFKQYILGSLNEEPTLIDDRNNVYIRIGTGTHSNYTEIFSTYILSIVHEKIESISKTIPIKVLGSNITFAPNSYKFGPNELLLDLYMFDRTNFDTSDYCVFLINIKNGNTYGIKIGDKSVVIDLFAMDIMMEGIYTKKTGIGKTQVFEFFGK